MALLPDGSGSITTNADGNTTTSYDPDLIKRLRRASFGGVEIVYDEIKVIGGMRKHVHEYPHQPGGAPEKLGRQLTEVHIRGVFLVALAGDDTNRWNTLNALQKWFENGDTLKLVVPQLGTLDAFCYGWERTLSSKMRSGELGDLKFLEDQSSKFSIDDTLKVDQISRQETYDAFSLAAAPYRKPNSLLDDLLNAASDVQSYIDKGNLYANQLAAKVESLVNLCVVADRDIKEFNDPTNTALTQAFLDLWMATGDLANDLQGTGRALLTWVVPMQMDLSSIANGIYGDAARGTDLLGLNYIADFTAVPAGSKIRYYA